MNVLSYNITRQKLVANNAFFSLITYVKLLRVGVIPLYEIERLTSKLNGYIYICGLFGEQSRSWPIDRIIIHLNPTLFLVIEY